MYSLPTINLSLPAHVCWLRPPDQSPPVHCSNCVRMSSLFKDKNGRKSTAPLFITSCIYSNLYCQTEQEKKSQEGHKHKEVGQSWVHCNWRADTPTLIVQLPAFVNSCGLSVSTFPLIFLPFKDGKYNFLGGEMILGPIEANWKTMRLSWTWPLPEVLIHIILWATCLRHMVIDHTITLGTCVSRYHH